MADERIVIDVEAETRKFQRGLDKAAKETRTFASKVKSQLSKVRGSFDKLGGSIASAFAFTPTDIINGVKALNDFVNATAESVSEMDAFAKATGLSIETIAGLKQAAEFSGKELSELVPVELAKKIQEAGTGAGEAAVLFKSVGVEAKGTSGKLKSADVVFREVLEGLQGIENEAERAAIASKLLGEQGAQMLSAFDGQEGLDNFVQLAEHYGTSAGPEAVRITKEWQKGTAMLSTAFNGAGSSIFDAFGESAARHLQSFSVGFTYMVNFVQEGLKELGERFDLFKKVLSGDLSAAAELAGKAFGDLTLTDFREAMDNAKVKTFDFIRATNKATETTEKLTKATSEAAPVISSITPKVKEQAEKLKSLADITSELSGIQATASEKRKAQLDAEIAKIGELTEATVDGFLAGKITAEQLEAFNSQALNRTKRAEQDYTDWLAEQQRVRTEDAALAEEERLELLEKTMEARRELTKEERIENRKTAADSVQMEIGKAKAITDSVSATTSAIIGSLDTRTKKGRDGARKVFAAQKAANIASITMDAAAGAARAFRDLPFPAAAITSGLAFAAAIAQISVVAKQRPKFHLGTRAANNAPDETNATITKNEAVITPQAMETVANLNAGANPTAAPMMLQIDHKAFDMTVKRLARIPSTSTAQLIANKTPPGRRSRRK